MDARLLLDVCLVVSLLVTAAGSLLSTDLFRGVVLFIGFGLIMSLAWVRLHATDLAMAEAAIGAGLAGALLLDAVGHLGRSRHPSARLLPWIEGGLCLFLLGTLGLAMLAMPEAPSTLGGALNANMDASGMNHAVTAVLLNFRGFDTFLEISVLAAAAFISLALQAPHPEPPPLHHISNRLLDALVAWLAPLMLLFAVYLFWAGSKEPGGAFQAGALLAAGGVLLRLSGKPIPCLAPGLPLRLGLAAGLCAFLLAGMSGPLFGRPLFSYDSASAHLVLVSVEAVLTLSIGVTLLSLFSAAPPVERELEL